MKIRTDLAAESEAFKTHKKIDGITEKNENYPEEQLSVYTIIIENEKAAEIIGREQGTYVTVRAQDSTFDSYCENYSRRVEIIAGIIKSLCEDAGKILCAGLGNRNITPDEIGPVCADKIFATRHIKELASEIDASGLGDVSVVSPGVLGQTGIEASDIIKTVCDKVQPEAVIVCDALACSDINNLGRTIQICNTGISPGSGVANSRKELSKRTLGTLCIAVGVPTVVDMTTAVHQLTDGKINEKVENMMVTPRNIDRLAENSASYIAAAVNRAFHPSLSLEELESLVW